jgi:hypothetical protein
MNFVNITLSYTGHLADNHEVDLYDVSQALIGFQRSLALTTHLVLNDEIITQAPSLKGAQILALPSEEGSWKLTAAIIAAGTMAYQLGTAPHDTPIGHLVSSAYDYVISESLGFHVDYKKTLGQQYEELKKSKTEPPIRPLTQSRFDSLVEKCEVAVREMHRPISKSRTATEARLMARFESSHELIGQPLNLESYEYISFTERSSDIGQYNGMISSYNMNTFKGRIYVEAEGRPIPFELGDSARGVPSVRKVTNSLSANAQKNEHGAVITFDAFRNTSKSGRLKSFLITQIY